MVTKAIGLDAVVVRGVQNLISKEGITEKRAFSKTIQQSLLASYIFSIFIFVP